MRDGKTTRITLREDWPTAITSSAGHANLTTVGFNIEFIVRRRPSLAVEITKLYDEARRLRADDPQAPEEDIHAAAEEWSAFIDTVSRD